MYKKYIIHLKNKIIKKRKEEEEIKKENSTELQKPNTEGEVYKNSKKCD